MKRIEQLIKEFTELEALGESIQKRAYRARKELEQFSAPAPKGKKGLSNADTAALRANFRASLLKKTA